MLTYSIKSKEIKKKSKPEVIVVKYEKDTFPQTINTYTPGDNTTYNPFTGELVLDIGTHSLQILDRVSLAPNSISFTYIENDETITVTKPSSTDSIAGNYNKLVINARTSTTITVTIATSAITIYKGNEFKDWNGHALVTSLKDQSLRKLIFKNKKEVKEEIIFKGKIGRIRDIQIHPVNGKIFFLAGDSLWLMEKK